MSKIYDPDAPLTDEEMKNSKWMRAHELPAEAQRAVANVRRGRPPAENPKERVTIRLDADLLQQLRDSGAGWQTRVNDMVRAGLHGSD